MDQPRRQTPFQKCPFSTALLGQAVGSSRTHAPSKHPSAPLPLLSISSTSSYPVTSHIALKYIDMSSNEGKKAEEGPTDNPAWVQIPQAPFFSGLNQHPIVVPDGNEVARDFGPTEAEGSQTEATLRRLFNVLGVDESSSSTSRATDPSMTSFLAVPEFPDRQQGLLYGGSVLHWNQPQVPRHTHKRSVKSIDLLSVGSGRESISVKLETETSDDEVPENPEWGLLGSDLPKKRGKLNPGLGPTCESCHGTKGLPRASIFLDKSNSTDYNCSIPRRICKTCQTSLEEGENIPFQDLQEQPKRQDHSFASFAETEALMMGVCDVKKCASIGPLVPTDQGDNGYVRLCIRHEDTVIDDMERKPYSTALWDRIEEDTRCFTDPRQRLNWIRSHSYWPAFSSQRDFGFSNGIEVTWEHKHKTASCGALSWAFYRERSQAYQNKDMLSRWRCREKLNDDENNVCLNMSATYLSPDDTAPPCRQHENTGVTRDSCVTCGTSGTVTILTGARCLPCYEFSTMGFEVQVTEDQFSEAAESALRDGESFVPKMATPWVVMWDEKRTRLSQAAGTSNAE